MPRPNLSRRLDAIEHAARATFGELLHDEVGAAVRLDLPRWDAWVAALSDDEREREDARLTAAAKAVCARHVPAMLPHVEALDTWFERVAGDDVPAAPPYVPTRAERLRLDTLASACPDGGAEVPRERVAAVMLGCLATYARAAGRWHAGERPPVHGQLMHG
jgi:hypothetical protein